MPLIRADRVKESSTSTGTSAFLLNGADSTYRTFASVCAVGDTVYYAIAHRSANEWEVGLGTYSAVNTLTRTTVHASSNANAAVAFSTGTKDVLLALTKAQLETYATLAGTETLTNKTISGANNTITNVSLTSGVTGTLPLVNGGTGTTTAQLAINALAGAVTSGSYLRGNGTNVVMATIAAGDVPTLNQSTTGTASGSVSGTASYLAKFTSTNVVGNSLIYDSGTNVGIGTASPSGRVHISATGTAEAKIEGTTAAYLSFIRSGVNFGYVGLGSSGNSDIYIYNLNSGAVRINNQAVFVTAANLVGVNEQSPGAQLQVTTAAATTKALVVRGASAQSANLQEWQNNAGTALARVDPAGNFYAPGGYLSGTSNAGGAFLGVSKWLGMDGEYINIRKLYGVRSFPNTYANGDYVEIAQIGRWSVQPITLTIHAGHGAVYGQAGKTYIIQSNGGDFTAAPLSSAATGDFDFDVEVVSFNTYWCKIRARRISSTAPTYADFMFTIECHNFNRTGITEVSGTGNSASALGYNSEYMRIGPNVSAPPPVGGSGAGTSLSISAASAIGTGAGGSILLQAGAFSTSGSNGKVIVRGLASNTANLQEWQNSAGTALALVDASGNVQTAGSIQITSNTPSAFTADQNNLALTASGFQRLSGTAARNITGIAPPSGSHVDGRMIRLYNVGSFNLTLKHNSTSSTAANRFWNVQAIDIIVGANDYAELIYDGTNNGSGAAGWRVA